jgi:hypothetical protein
VKPAADFKNQPTHPKNISGRKVEEKRSFSGNFLVKLFSKKG